MTDYDGLLALDRMERAVEKVRDRLLRSTAALEAADEAARGDARGMARGGGGGGGEKKRRRHE